MDAIALAWFALGGVILVGAGVVASWPTQDADTPPPSDQPSGVATFHVVALGLEGAGKTVLLATQFHRFRETGPRRRYFLDGNLKQDRQLAQTYTAVSDTSAPWPPGTQIGDEREFVFDCNAYDRAGNRRTVFQIKYLDYAGDLLEPQREHTTADQLEQRVGEAQALLVILDGRRVLQSLRGEPAGHDYFERRMWPLLGLARRAECPVQLVLTKWDLLRSFDDPIDDDAGLERIGRHLLEYGGIRDLVRAHSQHQEYVRLIPVSAVGQKFTELADDGRVAKRMDGTLDPIHVEVPLCAVIPDLLKQIEQSLAPSIRKELDTDISRRRRRDLMPIVATVLNSPAGTALRNVIALKVGPALVDFVLEVLVNRRAGASEAVSGGASDDTEPQPDNDDAAEVLWLRNAVIADMERVVTGFEHHLEHSILSSR
jgi:hypothetical protein